MSNNLISQPGASDGRWKVTRGWVWGTVVTVPAKVVTPMNANWDSKWYDNGPKSTWICRNPDSPYQESNIIFSTSFNLAGYRSEHLALNALWGTSAQGVVKLNGHVICKNGNAEQLSSCKLPQGSSMFKPQGTNELTIEITGSDVIGGVVRFEGTVYEDNATPVVAIIIITVSVVFGLCCIGGIIIYCCCMRQPQQTSEYTQPVQASKGEVAESLPNNGLTNAYTAAPPPGLN